MHAMRGLLTAAVLLAVAAGAAQERGRIEEGGRGWVERIDKVVDVGPGGTLVVSADRGGISVETWTEAGVRVQIEKDVDVFTEAEARRVLEDYGVDISREGDDVRVAAASQSERGTRSLAVSLKFYVPTPYSVDVQTEGGGITVGDLEGHAKARTGGGGITVGHIRNGSVDASTSGGGIAIGGIDNGDGLAVTSGGGIHVGDVTGRLEARTSGGGVDVGAVGGELRVETSGGDIRIGKSRGPVSAQTGGGGIAVEGAGASLVVTTGGGGIDIGQAGGAVRAETGGGGIALKGAAGPVVVRTGGGGIALEQVRGSIEASTGGGGIRAEVATADPEVDTHCALESGGGDLEIYLSADLQATVDAEVSLQRPKRTYAITSDFALQITGDGSRSGRLVGRGTINGGGDLIRLRTANGDIAIHKR